MSRMILSSPLTHSDWMLKKDGPEWGPAGVRHMLTRCKDFGFDKVFWRCYDCGRSTYHGRLVEPFRWVDHEEIYQYSPGFIPPPDAETLKRCEKLDYYGFDTLKAAVEIGHDLGLEIYGWMTLNEDDHGLGWPSRFTREHPDCRWVRRNGEPYRSQLSFAFPEVREYKLGLVREVLGYDVDGILLDWIRTGDIRDNPQADEQGNADFGYEKPNWVPEEASGFERDLRIAEQLGAREMLFWEADYIDSRPADKLEAIMKTIRSYRNRTS